MSNQYQNFEANTAVLQEENLEMLRELRSLYELHISLLREAVSLKEALVESNQPNCNRAGPAKDWRPAPPFFHSTHLTATKKTLPFWQGFFLSMHNQITDNRSGLCQEKHGNGRYLFLRQRLVE
jgi:hypothetical protein